MARGSRFSLKAVFIFAGSMLVILSVGLLLVISSYLSREALLESAKKGVVITQTIQKKQIEDFFSEHIEDIDVLVEMPFVKKAIVEFDDVTKQAKRFGIQGKALLKYGPYRVVYNRYYTLFKKYMKSYGYSDLFLFSPNSGRVLMSVALEDDFGTELKTEKTHLADAWRTMKSTMKLVVSDMEAYAPSKGAQAMFLVTPVTIEGRYIGSLGFQLPNEKINAIVQERAGMGETGETYLVGLNKGTTSLRSDRIVKEGKIGEPKKGEFITRALKGESGMAVKVGSTGDREIVMYSPLKIKGLKWMINTTKAVSEVNIPADNLVRTMLVAGALIILVSALFYFIFVSFRLSRPLKLFREKFIAGSQGDLSVRYPRPAEHGDEIEQLGFYFNNFMDKLDEIIDEVTRNAEQLYDASMEIRSTSVELSENANVQAANIEEINASQEEISSSITQNTNNSKDANIKSRESSSGAEEGSSMVNRTLEAMKKISERIGLIDDIAYQTNLLALNAAIEAARAGESGKGFAVVAGEVRKLAEKSQLASQEIVELVQESLDLSRNSSEIINRIIPELRESAVMVEEITVASEEQQQGIEQINTGMNQLNEIAQVTAASSEELSSTAEMLKEQAGQLREALAYFNKAEAVNTTAETSHGAALLPEQ